MRKQADVAEWCTVPWVTGGGAETGRCCCKRRGGDVWGRGGGGTVEDKIKQYRSWWDYACGLGVWLCTHATAGVPHTVTRHRAAPPAAPTEGCFGVPSVKTRCRSRYHRCRCRAVHTHTHPTLSVQHTYLRHGSARLEHRSQLPLLCRQHLLQLSRRGRCCHADTHAAREGQGTPACAAAAEAVGLVLHGATAALGA